MYDKPTQKHLDQMLNFIQNTMKFDTWYPVKTDLAYDTIMLLFSEGIIDNCELNADESQIRKIDVDFNPYVKTRTWYDK